MGFLSAKKVTTSFPFCLHNSGLKNSRIHLVTKISAVNRMKASANSITKRIGARTARWRTDLDQWRDLGCDEALAGVPDRSRLPGTVHGIGVQLHGSARASGFGNVATERIRRVVKFFQRVRTKHYE
jgi:hypothetical protein